MWEIVPLSMDGQILLLYSIFYRRNKVAAAARVAWPGNVIPTFRNNKENMKKLDELVVELETEYSLPYFGKEAIKQHILSCLTERRGNVKRGYDYEQVSQCYSYVFIILLSSTC